MNPFVEINDKNYERKPVKTRLLNFGDDLMQAIKDYVLPEKQNNDWLAISEKVVSVCQNNVRHISTVKAGFLAKFIVKFVKKYPNDIGFSRPEKMQVAVEMSGAPRILAAIALGTLGKIIGIRGIFWRVAGNRVSEIDGFNPAAMYPYTEYAILPPRDPEKICNEIEKRFNLPAVIIDGNNINTKIIAESRGMPVNKKLSRLILLDNPMGQDDEMTPFILVREKK
ncbi:MAG: coenzyme F420-0:L-glutamate ligase [Candidatus Staskawiczbacteria bacterium]|nr:coenzyme F420-0:L-glutamate ligase [Candidatus Staskawiczbacteria bacterium]